MSARVTISIEGSTREVLEALVGLVDISRFADDQLVVEPSDVPAVPAASTPSASGEEDVVEEVPAPEETSTSSGAAAALISCPDCGKGYRGPQGLGRHRQAAHGITGAHTSTRRAERQADHGGDDLVCPECGRECANAVGLGVHRKRAHGVSSPHRSGPGPVATPEPAVDAVDEPPVDEVESAREELDPAAYNLRKVARLVRDAGPTDHTPTLVADAMGVTKDEARQLIVAARDAGHFQVRS